MTTAKRTKTSSRPKHRTFLYAAVSLLACAILGCPLLIGCSDDGKNGRSDADATTNDDASTNSNQSLTVTGDLTHGASVTVTGGGFGEKTTAPPFRASYQHPDAAQRFQENGEFDETYWSLGAADIMVTLADDLPDARVKERPSHRYYVRLEYSARGNWEAGGYSAGVQTHLPQSTVLYLSWWDFFEPGFDASHMSTGAANFKWIYIR